VICALDGCEKSEIRRQRNKDDWQGVAMWRMQFWSGREG
jgi:hypothetical protein